MDNRMRHAEIFRTAMLLALAALGVSAATAQTDFSFAAGVDSTGWAQAQSNADGHVLIESPQYPHGLWLHLVDETGDALAGIQVEYQGRPDSLVAIRCVDPVGSVRETLIWSRPDGDPLRLTLKPKEVADLPAGLAAIDWQIDPTVVSLLEPVAETRLESWEAVEMFLRARWQGQAGRVAVQFNDSTSTSLAVEMDHPETIETLVAHLQQVNQPASAPFGETTPYEAQMFVEVRIFEGILGLQEGLILSISLFKDAVLEAAVRQAVGRPQGRLTSEAITSLTELLVTNSAVRNLAGLQHFTALQRLVLNNNQIADVTPLANLNNLQELWLSFNQIADVTSLTNLTNLQELWLWSNQLADVTPLANLNNLQSLVLASNQIADVTPLASLNNLESLSDNQIADVTPLANLNNLRRLELSDNQIADVRPLAGLTNLQLLWLSGNQLTDVGPLAGLTNLKELRLSSNQIADVTPLTNLNNLDYLELSNNQIADVRPLANLNNLRSLFLSNNPLSDQALNEQIPALQARGVNVFF